MINNWSWIKMSRTGEIKGLHLYFLLLLRLLHLYLNCGLERVLSEATHGVSSARWLPADGARGSRLLPESL